MTQLSRAQLLAFDQPIGAALALRIARAKLSNQAGLLRYYARLRARPRRATPADTGTALPQAQPQSSAQEQPLARVAQRALLDLAQTVADHLAELDALAVRVSADPKITIDAIRPVLLSIEGRAAQQYWHGVGLLLPSTLNWPGRRHRGAQDLFNSALNYGYAILGRWVEQAIVLAGLDPFAGFVHVDRPGKPSLTLDLIEEFRQPVVDRVLLGLIGRSTALAIDEAGRLDDATRKSIAQHLTARLEESAEPFEGQRRLLREVLQTQARHLATYLRGDRTGYEGFVSKW